MASDQVQYPVELEEEPAVTEERKTVADTASGAEIPLPVLAPTKPELSARDEPLQLLRRFHLGGPTEPSELERVGEEIVPALLAPYQDTSKIRYEFPLLLFPAGDWEQERLAASLADFVKEIISGFAPATDQARILKDNLARIEKFVKEALNDSTSMVDAVELLTRAASAMQEELGLDDANRKNLQDGLDKMLAAVPQGSHILGYGEHATVHLFLHATRHRLVPRRRAFAFHVNQVVQQLRALLEVERRKSPGALKPEAIETAVGKAGSQFIDPVALAKTMGHIKGTQTIAADRRDRIEKSLQVLESFLDGKAPPLVILVHDGTVASTWVEGETDYELEKSNDPSLAASSLFEHKSAGLSQVFRSLRIAELELSQSYEADLHDPWFASFNWEAFSREELQLLPVVAALDHADHIASKGLWSFSRLLRSGRPAQLLVLVTPGQNPGTEPGEDPLASYRFELGYTGISHREALVAQSSLARPQHLIEGFLRALDTTRTGLHLLSTGAGTSSSFNPWLSAGAALEGRAHPFFRYNPEAGLSWAQSVDFAENPEPESDWPSHPLEYREADSEGTQSTFVAFTFADFALLDPTLREHFRLVPEGYTRDELTPVDAYLTLDPGQAIKYVPFIWGIDGESRLRRLVLSRELVLSCRDRLGYWQTLQSLAGVKNEYADTAAKLARDEALAEAAEERKNLVAAQEEEVARVREETAGQVMGRLTDVLMGLDLTQTQVAAPRPASAPSESAPGAEAPADAPAAVAEAAPAAAEEEEEVSFDEPWIDTMLCTSCNDCMKFNALVFVYNENKQALIGDAKAGTFEQLVMAAEKCPARCIHPGKPLNPDEPNLDELIERAKPFN